MSKFQDLISITELRDTLAGGNCRVVDCRFDLMQPRKGHQDYLEGHIPGAVFADLDEDLADPVTTESGRHPLPDPERFMAQVADWGISNATQVIAYDGGNGALAARFWWLMRWVGHDKVAVLDGGLAAWGDAGGDIESGPVNVEPAAFDGVADYDRVVTTDEIEQTIFQNKPFILVDARDERRFMGEVEPIDKVAGHIPGAINLPLTRNVGANGLWHSAAELGELWRGTLPDSPSGPFIAMCGSGVTACHLVLSARLAGIDEPRVYVGSWSEWIRDSSRPIVQAEKAENA